MIFTKARVIFRSGSGGKGSSSFVRSSSGSSFGAGGDGGSGGAIILKVDQHLYDLRNFKGKKKFLASSGEVGSKQNKKGRDAPDLIVGVPSGTRVFDVFGDLIVDLIGQDEQFILCRGGSGGLGNFKRNYTTSPQDGQEKEVILDYRIPNQVAILGFANSGKTTIFNALTGQNQKVADYPFTTLSCVWAPVDYEFKRFVILDMPPLTRIKKPSQQTKNDFLSQILRSQIILFVSEATADYKSDFKDILAEINRYDANLMDGKKIFYLLAKIDTIDTKVKDNKIMLLAAKQNQGLEELKAAIIEELGD